MRWRLRWADNQQIGFQPLPVAKEEPLRLEVEAFLEAVRTRNAPAGAGRRRAAGARSGARDILDKIEEHSKLVTQRLQSLT